LAGGVSQLQDVLFFVVEDLTKKKISIVKRFFLFEIIPKIKAL
jgi:hypothetical protein